MRFLRTNTAIRLTVGPFMDKTDGVTPETALTVTNCKLTLMVDDANVPTIVIDASATASGGNNDMVHVTGDDAGFYDLELTAAQLNYLGRAMLAITDAANHCPVFHEFMILPAMIYDSLVLGTDRLDTNVTHITDQSQTARDIGASVLLSSGTGTGQVKLSSGYVAPNWGDVGNPTTSLNLSGTTIATVTNQLTAAQIATGVWTDTTAGDFTTALSVGKSIMNGVSLGTGLTIAAVSGAVGSVTGTVGGIAGTTQTLDALDTALNSAHGAGSWATATGFSTLDAAGVRTAVGLASANLDTQLAAIVADTNELQTDNVDGGRTDLLVDAIKAKTDSLTFTVATMVDANVIDWKGATAPAMTGDAFARLGAPVGASISADIAAVQADLPQRITKNTALSAFPFFMVLSSDHVTGATGLTVTATRSLDGAAFASCANAVSEIANGWYKIDLDAADLNGTTVALKFTAATADARMITIITEPT